MTDIVVDTNVWAMVDKSIAEVTTVEELDCIEVCKDWLKSFIESEDRLIVDLSYQILLEYRQNIKRGGLAEQRLNQLETQPRERLYEVEIEFDNNGKAILPEDIEFHDPSDRKFVAVAIQSDPYAPIYNATDTDWAKEKDKLIAQGFTIHELCDDYIQAKLKEN